MHILYLTGETIPGDNGGSVHAMEVAANFVRLGHQVDLVANRAPGDSEKEVIAGVKVRRIRQQIRGRTAPLLAAQKILSFFRADYDLILERFSALGGTGVIVSLVKGIPLVCEVNSPHTEELIWRYNLRNPVKGLLRGWRRLQFRLSDVLLATRRSLVPRLSRKKVELVEWAANTEMFHEELRDSARVRRLRWQYDLHDKTVVLFLGSFRPWHGIHRLPEIADRVVRENDEIRFLLVGDGEGAPRVRKEIADRGLSDYVVFAGSHPYHDIPYFVACADIAIAPFDAEKFEPLERFGFYWSPLKIFESMAVGVPVVTFAYDTLSRLVGDDERGVAVAPGNIAAMTTAVLDLARDDARRSALSTAAREFVKLRYTWQGHVEHLERLFVDLLEKRPARSGLF